ncbi:lysylphosphatidylglycerol synthase transmembrane domain-containing protein [Rickettsiales endosymbiont of Stachyamoeba lipophora]|uniref:lysylphosphatidylglycerol synthase transmembrane domain-containing protein n=1 Tax=Rickettsiales endosymbiont of Stachyamoeba lipophora TaxID=2486578 RepID=UPI000F653250|nr:lysylphosphatidylglycerol synthase transmembrane domain-containing protein [Rickettsiales endosymbiont of Stachyamoeba lipophora]AZL15030.1 UPF0104 family protein [Rickettsiales endosymbiont of Stachyamoeba lipophora]
MKLIINKLKKIFHNKPFNFLLKTIGFIILFYFILTKIDLNDLLITFKKIKLKTLIFSIILVNISYLFNALRFKAYLDYDNQQYSLKDAINITYRCSFFNSCLPGGIGGDGYKFLLLKQYGMSKIRAIQLCLSDRISGLYVIAIACFILLLATNIKFLQGIHLSYVIIITSLGIILSTIVYNIIAQTLKEKRAATAKAFIFSLLNEIAIVMTQMVIYGDLGVKIFDLNYILATLISFLSLIVPISLGGAGVREVCLVFLSNYILIDADTALLGALCFFCICTIINILSSISFLIKIEHK